MKKLFAMAAFVAAAMSASAQEEVTPRAPIVPWGAQAEIIITNDLTEKYSDGSWHLTADAQKWIEYSYDGTTENGTIQQTNRPNVWFDFYNETTDTMIVTSEELNWGGYLTVSSKTGSTEGLMIVGKNRYPAFYVTGTDKAKFYFSGSAGTAGYPQIEVYEVGGETPVATYTGDYALTKKTWDHSTLLIADGLDKAKSYKIVARTMNKVDDTTFGYEGGDIVLQVLKFYGDQAPMREDGTIISGSELGSYINQHLAAYPEVRAFSLEGSGKYTITEGIVSDSTLTITGVANAPATIDASGLAAPFIKFNGGKTKLMKPAPTVDPETGDSTYVESSFYDVPEAVIANVKITGLAQSLINDAQKSLFGKIDIINDNIELAGSSAVFAINGYPTKLTINKSTLWSAEGHKGFLFQVQGRPMKDYDADATTTFSIENSTLFQIGVGKKINNNNSGIKGQTCLYLNLSKSVLVNTGSSVGGEITGWLFGQNSPNPTVTYDQNTYWNLGTKEVTNEETGEVTTESVSEVVPGWTDASKVGADTTATQLTTAPFVLDKAVAGNFTVGANSQQAKYMTGDPRWLVPYATDAIKIEVDQSENTDFAAVLNEKLQLSEQPSSITIQFFEAGEYPLTQEINTTAPITIQNGSDIDAGEATIVVNNGMVLGGAIKIDGINLKAGDELAAPVIALQANPYMLQDNGYYNLSKIQLLNLKVTGLKTHLIQGVKGIQIPEIETKNCEIYMAGKISGSSNTPAIYDFRQGGVPVTWNFVKSTLDANDNCIFSTAGGEKAGNVEGVTMQTLNISEATIINPVKKSFQHRQNNQKWLRYILKSSIIMVNKDKPNFVAEMNAGSTGGNPTWQIDKNSFMQVNTETNEETGEVTTTIIDVSDKQGTGDNDEPVTNSLTGVTTFADQANYDFTIEASSEQASKKVGDPRWLVDFVSPFAEFYGIVGAFTSWDDDLEMTMTKWGIYEATIEGVNVPVVKDFEYKLRTDKNWEGYELPASGNNVWTPDTVGMFKVTFIADVLNNTLTAVAERTGDAEAVENVYTVAGAYKVEGTEDAAFFGSAWDINNENNEMTLGEDGIYTLTFEGVKLENAGTILYKVVENHSWGTNWGFNGDNADYVINEPGTYNITFYFNPVALLENNFNVDCVAVKQVLKGDVNNDGQVGIGDIVAITNVMAGIEEDEAIKAAADVNGDGQVGIGDIVAITNIMAGTPENAEEPVEE